MTKPRISVSLIWHVGPYSARRENNSQQSKKTACLPVPLAFILSPNLPPLYARIPTTTTPNAGLILMTIPRGSTITTKCNI